MTVPTSESEVVEINDDILSEWVKSGVVENGNCVR